MLTTLFVLLALLFIILIAIGRLALEQGLLYLFLLVVAWLLVTRLLV